MAQKKIGDTRSRATVVIPRSKAGKNLSTMGKEAAADRPIESTLTTSKKPVNIEFYGC
jgi:hypothetical protein